MTKDVTTVSEEGFTSTSEIRDFDLFVDPGGDEAPDTVEILLADYAACAIPAFRVGARQRGVEDLGRVQIDASGEVDDDGKLQSVSFDVTVDAALDDGKDEEIIERVEALCKVHDALKESLHADMSLSGGA